MLNLDHLIRTVILSEAGASRSEALAQSKDPVPAAKYDEPIEAFSRRARRCLLDRVALRKLLREYFRSRPIEDCGDSLSFFEIRSMFAAERVFELMPRTMQLIASPRFRLPHSSKCLAHLIHASADPRQRIENRFSRRLVGGEMRLSFRSNAVKLPRPLLLHARVSNVMQISEGWINHPGTRTVESAGPLLQRLDQFISVHWTLRQQGQDH